MNSYVSVALSKELLSTSLAVHPRSAQHMVAEQELRWVNNYLSEEMARFELRFFPLLSRYKGKACS
jgi:hypothetical protein